jgi:hypothetical protein
MDALIDIAIFMPGFVFFRIWCLPPFWALHGLSENRGTQPPQKSMPDPGNMFQLK